MVIISLSASAKRQKRKRKVILSLIGTYGYVTPEILQNKTITDRCDAYSIGIVLLKNGMQGQGGRCQEAETPCGG